MQIEHRPRINSSCRSAKARSGIFTAVLALLPAIAPLPSQAQSLPVTDNTAPPYLGIFGGGFRDQSGIRMDKFHAEWLRRSSIHAMVFAGTNGTSGGQPLYTWDAIAGNVTYSNPVDYYERWCNAHPDSKLMISLAMLPGIGRDPVSGITFAKGARGDYDTYFRQLATKLRDRGICDQVIIRPGWEFNGNWYPWAIQPLSAEYDAPHFAAYFCRISRVMRGADGLLPATSTTDPGMDPANIKFNWCGAKYRHTIPYNVRTAYPGGTPAATTTTGVSYPAYAGDDYVHSVGVDIYDTDAFGNTYNNSNPPYSEALTNSNFNIIKGSDNDDNNGIARWKAIAVEHGKTLSFPEWGVSNESRTTSLPAGGFDNPWFIIKMFNYIHDPANNVESAFYFEDNNSTGTCRLSPFDGYVTQFPNAALKYRELFTPPLPTRTNIGSISATTSANGLKIAGAGAGYPSTSTATSDSFYFTSRACPNLDMMMVKLTSASVAAGQSGLMLRQNTTSGAVNAALFVSSGTLRFQYRSAANASTSSSTVASGVTYPLWLKLVRDGTSVTAYRSGDGLNWTFAAGQILSALTGTAQIGMAVSSGAAATLNTVGIDRLDDPFHAMGDEVAISNKVIKDNADSTGVTITGGGWAAPTTSPEKYLANYLFGEPSDGAMSVTFSPAITGLCDLYVHWPTSKAGAYDAPITVNYNGSGSPAHLIGDQGAGANKWVYAGTYNMNSSSNVILRNSLTSDTPGLVESTIVDAVMFVPLPSPAGAVYYEAETISGITSSQDDAVSVFYETAASGGAGSKLASDEATDFIQYPLLNVPAGTYTIKVRYKRNITRGIFRLSIDGDDFGSLVDEYGTGAYIEATVGTGKTLTAGTHNFRFTVTGRNAGSSDYDLTVDRITLEP